MEGWICVHRKIIDWEWYHDPIVFRVFFHLILVANREEKTWQGIVIKRGQTLRTIDRISKETGISIQSVRTAIKKLKSTNELTIQTDTKNHLITITCYEKYQSTNKPTNKPLTNEQQTINKPSTANNTINNQDTKNTVSNIDNSQGSLSVDFEDDLSENKADEKTKTQPKQKEILPSPPCYVDLKDWNDFMEVRKFKKAANTAGAINCLIKEIEDYHAEGHDVNQLIRNSTKNSWKVLYLPNQTQKKQATGDVNAKWDNPDAPPAAIKYKMATVPEGY